MHLRFLLLISFSVLYFSNTLNAQKHDLRLVIQGSSYATSMINNTNGTFGTNNSASGFINFGLRYRYEKISAGIGITNFPVPMEMLLTKFYFGGSQGPIRFTTIPLEFGYQVAKFYKNKIAIDAQVGSYLLMNRETGEIGRGLISTSDGSSSWTYQMNFNRSFSAVPFVGVELRQARLRQFNVGIGYLRMIGIQQLGITNIQYSETGRPTENYSLENRGSGDNFYLSVGIRLWKIRND